MFWCSLSSCLLFEKKKPRIRVSINNFWFDQSVVLFEPRAGWFYRDISWTELEENFQHKYSTPLTPFDEPPPPPILDAWFVAQLIGWHSFLYHVHVILLGFKVMYSRKEFIWLILVGSIVFNTMHVDARICEKLWLYSLIRYSRIYMQKCITYIVWLFDITYEERFSFITLSLQTTFFRSRKCSSNSEWMRQSTNIQTTQHWRLFQIPATKQMFCWLSVKANSFFPSKAKKNPLA